MRRRLLKRQRIRNEKTFQAIFRNGQFVRGKGLNLWICRKSENADAPQTTAMAIMVSKKVSPLAVARNRIRRKIREAFRLGQDRFPENRYLLIQAKGLLTDRGPEDILKELLHLVHQAEGRT